MTRALGMLAILLISAGSLFAGPDDYVEWKPVPGSAGYQVQVRETRTKKILIDQTVEGTMLDVNLAPGLYESRVAPLSPFGRPIQWSDWRQLNVLIARKPDVNEHPKVVVETGKPTVVVITGTNFARAMRVSLKNESGSFPVEERKINEAGTEVFMTIPPGKYPQGEYDVVLENPRQKTITMPRMVFIRAPQEVAAKVDQTGKKTDPARTDKTDKTGKTDGKKDTNADKTRGDYREYLRTLPSTCKGSGLPDVLVKQCFKFHLVLDLSTREKVEMYHYLLAYQGNFSERMTGYNYFRTTCGPLSGQVKTFLEERLDLSRESLEASERDTIGHTLDYVKTCNASSNP